MTYLLFCLSILIWPFGQLLNFQIPWIPQTVYPLDIVCGLLTISLLLSAKNRQSIFRDPLFKPLCFFLLTASVSLLINLNLVMSNTLFYSLSYLIRLFIYPSIYFSARIFNKRNIYQLVLVSIAAFSMIGLIQYLVFPDMRFLKFLGFDDHYYRLIGSFFDPNYSGAIFAAVALFCVSASQWLAALMFILLLALTFSRASYLAFSLGLVYLLITKKKLVYIFLLVILALVLILIPKPFGEGVNLLRTFSIFSRFDSWRVGLDLFIQRPIIGWGYNTLRGIHGERFQIDNSFIYLAATTGVVGLLAFINLLRKIISSQKSLMIKLPILAIIIHSMFNNSLFYIWIYFFLWLVLGLSPKGYKES